MSTWHYRLIKHVYPKGEVYYAVHEYYPATEEVGDAWTLNPVALWGEDPDDIRWIIAKVRNDMGRLLNNHDIIEVKHDDYGVGYAEINGVNPCPMCGVDRNED
ncbi:hypothetical protein CRP125_gp47 [Roseobacter phage CRP-125]|uniref:Uncharacterized protein n=1 Tax=Roseobacter phage CRP-125 TaxID=3072844 RepID=A0AAX3ZVU8_9CAUD|nr:hypothetical protein CRP125_gp47 [Roseobacter phage CRP-125]